MTSYHLPKLLNPLLNAIFNCPDVDNSPLKKSYVKLKSLNDFIVIVPPTYMLLTQYDSKEKFTLQERCYHADFLLNHILVPSNPNLKFRIQPNNQLFHTLSGRDIIIRQRNNCLFTADGFEHRKKYNIIKFDTLINFNDYYSQRESVGYRKFNLIYIDQPLIDGKEDDLTRIDELRCFDQTRLKRATQVEGEHQYKSLFQKDVSMFDYFLNEKPEWARKLNTVLDKFIETSQRDFNILASSFNEISEEIYFLVKDEADLKGIHNLKRVVRNYCELKLYDHIWKVIITHFYPTSQDNTTFLHFLSLDQLDTEFYKQSFRTFKLSDIVQLEKHIERATMTFTRLSISNTFFQKSRILVETLQLLSKPIKRSDNTEIPIDADTLMSLFVLIINRLNSNNLKCHLYYLQNFYENENDTKFGLLGYAISTLEAVIIYMDSLNDDKKKCNTMLRKEKATIQFIEFITTSTNLRKDVHISSFKDHLRYRSNTGQSVLSICITNFQNNTAINLLSNKEFEVFYPLEDLLDDESIDGSTLLIQALKYSNNEMASILVDILKINCSENEIVLYLKRQDRDGRNAAHFLNDQVDLLEKIGKYIQWDSKDCTSQTPLFTIFRSYDQAHYDLMIRKSLELSDHWYKTKKKKPLDLEEHMDAKGNTLLHIVKSNVDILLNTVENINVNKCNKKGLTPLMVFVKYNRTQNVEIILNDPRTIFDKTKDRNGLDCFDYAQDEKIIELLGRHALENRTVFHHIFAHSLKFHQNTSYSLKVSVKISHSNISYSYKTFNLNLKTIKNLFRVLLKAYPLTFLPLNDFLLKLDNMASIFQQTNLKWVKLKDKEAILTWLTQCLESLIHMNILPISHILNDSISLIEWIQERKIKLKDTDKNSKSPDHRDSLEPEQINIIQNFLKFNLDELNNITPQLTAIKKLTVFLKLKKMDISDSKDLFRILSHDYHRRSISRLLIKYSEVKITPYGRASLDRLLRNLEYLETCVLGLSLNINQLLNFKIPAWWKLYGEMLELDKYGKQGKAYKTREDDHMHDNGGNVLTNFIENKKLKNERQIYERKTEIKKLLQRESREINYKHEQLAEELSKFVRFKSDYITLGLIKTCCEQNIKLLIHSVFNLESKQKRMEG
ncbi:hypothetical protein MOUN0_D04346 [Monosporozyma unispora]|nr:hypothetical protein C6P44_002466 [Kazachstania unispora]